MNNVPAEVAVLRQWALDAQTATNASNWSGATYNATKDNTLKTTIQRLGVLADHMADFLSTYAGDHLP